MTDMIGESWSNMICRFYDCNGIFGMRHSCAALVFCPAFVFPLPGFVPEHSTSNPGRLWRVNFQLEQSQAVAKTTGTAVAGSHEGGNACGTLRRNRVPQASSLRRRIARPLYE